MSAVVLFDMDRTLVGMDAFKGLGLALFRAGLVPRARALGLVSEQVGHLIGLRSMDQAMQRAYGLLAGCRHEPIERYTAEFVETIVPHIYAEAVDAIRAHQARGERVVLASASPEFLVRRVARTVGVDEVVATRVHIEGERFGALELPGAWGPGKVELARRAGLIEEPPVVYTDHVGDLDLVLAAGHATLVNPMPALVEAARRHRVPHRVVRWSKPWSAGNVPLIPDGRH